MSICTVHSLHHDNTSKVMIGLSAQGTYLLLVPKERKIRACLFRENILPHSCQLMTRGCNMYILQLQLRANVKRGSCRSL